MNWIIQDSNNQHKNWVNIYNAACEIGDDACFVSVDDDYTIEHIDKYSIVIGGDDFVDKCVKNKFLSCGIFRDDSFFNVCNYLEIFNEKYLNYDSEVVYFESIKKMSTSDVYFVRPYEDSKVFDGGVYSINDFIREYSYLNSDYMISLASQKNIDAEWRFVVVCKEIITASPYVGNIMIYDDLYTFVYSCINDIVAPDAYVIDVALSEGKYKVLECNTVNSSNFYNCDFKKIVLAMDQLMKKCECE